MMLKSSLSFDIKHDTVVGFEDYGSFIKCQSQGLQLMRCFLWCVDYARIRKQVLRYFFSCESASSAALTYFYMRQSENLCNVDLTL